MININGIEWTYVGIGAILVLEICFRIIYFIKHRKNYYFIPKLRFKDVYVEPHPYLPFAMKSNFTIKNKESNLRYPLLSGEKKHYIFPKMKTNNMRHINGESGNRNIGEKGENELRVHCIGGSTTYNYLSYKNKNYTYPLCLEKQLSESQNTHNIRVNNWGMGSWTSTELLIDFMLNGIETHPDILIIYHGYNDLGPSLTPNFKPDYSHAIRSIGEYYQRLKLTSILPNIPLAFYNYFISRYGGNIRHSLGKALNVNNIDYDSEFNGIETYKRNLEHIILIAKHRQIKSFYQPLFHTYMMKSKKIRSI